MYILICIFMILLLSAFVPLDMFIVKEKLKRKVEACFSRPYINSLVLHNTSQPLAGNFDLKTWPIPSSGFYPPPPSCLPLSSITLIGVTVNGLNPGAINCDHPGECSPEKDCLR